MACNAMLSDDCNSCPFLFLRNHSALQGTLEIKPVLPSQGQGCTTCPPSALVSPVETASIKALTVHSDGLNRMKLVYRSRTLQVRPQNCKMVRTKSRLVSQDAEKFSADYKWLLWAQNNHKPNLKVIHIHSAKLNSNCKGILLKLHILPNLNELCILKYLRICCLNYCLKQLYTFRKSIELECNSRPLDRHIVYVFTHNMWNT